MMQMNGTYNITNSSITSTAVEVSGADPIHPSTSYFVFLYLNCTFTSISVIMLAVGLFTIYLCDEKHNQNIILAGLTWSEMFGASGAALEVLLERSLANETVNIFLPVIRSLRSIGSLGILFSMFILTIDRVIMAASPLKYISQMHKTRRRTISCVAIALVIAVTLGIIKSVGNSPVLKQTLTDITEVIGIFYLAMAVGAYYFIFTKIQRSRRRFSSASSIEATRPRPLLKFQKRFLVPTVIILTFIVFHCVPFVVLINIYGYWEEDFVKQRSENLGYSICTLGSAIGFTTDVVTYIFFTPRYKRTLKRFSCFARRNDVRMQSYRLQ